MDFIPARNQKRVGGREVRGVVIHTMESPEKPGTARAVAKWFAGPNAPMASAHVCVDALEIVECVKPEDVAFAAPGANKDFYHIEHAGRAAQSELDWADDASQAMLKLSAVHAAGVALRFGIPVVRLTPAEIAAGKRGFCGHVDCTAAFKIDGGHVDPGAYFPWAQYLTLVENALIEMGPDIDAQKAE